MANRRNKAGVLVVSKINDPATIQWLLEGDPAIRWQVLQDLIGAATRKVDHERRKVALEGWGSRLLEKQDSTGVWARGLSIDSGLYTPKWTSTTYTMLLLRNFGLPANNRQAAKACKALLDYGLQHDGGINYGPWAKSMGGETCITGMVLSILSYFEFEDRRLDTIADHLLKAQMRDGGWNCRRARGATHSSVHTTISALEGLRLYQLHRSHKLAAVRTAQARGREFLLVHRLFRSHRTGEIIKSIFLRFSFPPRWHYDVLRALDYFRAVNAPRDLRLSEAIDLLVQKRTKDGRWLLENVFKGKTYFNMESLGSPSRWNTLRALRVLNWWEGN